MKPQPAFATLIDMLAQRAEHISDQAAFDFEGTPYSFAALWHDLNAMAAHLVGLGVGPGDRVITVLPNSCAFFPAFYGIQRAGGVAVPLFPGFGPDVILKFARQSGARILIVPETTPPEQLEAFRAKARSAGLILTSFAEARTDATAAPSFPSVSGDDLAFIQYTSGSTGDPKGVQISHANLITNIRQMIAGMQITERDIFVSWLPVYHDMGLILKTMVPFYLGCPLYLMRTGLDDVTRWLRAIETHRATFTAAPDFAYRLCLRQVSDPGAFDLTSLRVALNAAEPVRAATIESFEAAFGLGPVMVAGYGLAEATVGVSMWAPRTPPKVDAHGNVSVGKPFPEVEVAIVDNGKALPPGETGEITIATAALPSGYFGNEAATKALHWQPGWVFSGDLGYIDDDGDLFIVGRKKNVINQGGQNLHPQEFQTLTDQVPGIRYSIAVGIDRGRLAGEQVFIFAEVKGAETKSDDDLAGIVIAIVRALHTGTGLRPGKVVLLAPKTIPMTYNGKFQHVRLKQMFLSGALKDRILYPRP